MLWGQDATAQQLTSKNRASDPPCPTRNRTTRPHLAHLALYALASGLRETRRYWFEQVNRTPIQGRTDPSVFGVLCAPVGRGSGVAMGSLRAADIVKDRPGAPIRGGLGVGWGWGAITTVGEDCSADPNEGIESMPSGPRSRTGGPNTPR